MDLKLIIAFCLITSDTVPIQEEIHAYKDPIVIHYLRQISINLELISESGYHFSYRYDVLNHDKWVDNVFSEQILEIRNMYQEVKDAPSKYDIHMFPHSIEYIRELIEFNRRYVENLEMEKLWFPYRSELYDKVIAEANHLSYIHNLVNFSKSSFISTHGLRRNLKELRDLLGEDAYYRGELPPHVPVWRFRKL